VDESVEDGFFKYRAKSVQICFANWHRNGLQIIFSLDSSPLVFDVDDLSVANWDGIRAELFRRIRG
jgi:hypothetical protein